jgi:hypothetical protein
VAGVIYPKDGPRSRTSAGEVAIYEALARQLPDGWTAWHSLRLRTGDAWEGEGDFVVADPHRGFLVIDLLCRARHKRSSVALGVMWRRPASPTLIPRFIESYAT